MAVHAGHDITAGLAIKVGTAVPIKIFIIIVGGSPAPMLFRSPVKFVKVSSKLGAPYIV